MDELEGQRLKPAEDSASLASSTAEPINLEDSHYAKLQADLECDAQGLEAESWSLAVDQNYLMSLNKEAVKRQDVIYELIQTEMHLVRTLKILFHIYMNELKQFSGFENALLERIFPGVAVLLSLHQHLLSSFKLRQDQSRDRENPSNYYITQLGDILIKQFSGNLGEQMMLAYGHFCSHYSEAVSLYKEQMQNNKKLQILIRKIDQLPLVRRLTIPECFLLVTQRITKYPVLLERIIQNTDADTEEFMLLEKALELIKHTIFQVDTQVSESQKNARLREISYRLELKAPIRLKDGQMFRKEDMMLGNKTLLREGALTWKLSGKQKEIQAVLLLDMLLLLQEKDQKLVLSAMDNKQPVISLQRVIVREVAHEEKGMYIICACTSGLPEMYELHAGTKEECKTWMDLIREAVNCYRDTEVQSKVMAKLQHYQDLLQQSDNKIRQSLEEKQEIFSTLYNEVVGQEAPNEGLLLRGDASDLKQGEALLNGALKEVEKLQNLLFMRIKHTEVSEDETDIQQDGDKDKNGELALTSCDHLLENLAISEDLETCVDDESENQPEQHCGSTSSVFLRTEVFDSVQNLAQKLYSLQAVVTQQDSRIELQKIFMSKSKLPVRSNSNVLLEQEKYRNLEKQKEELAKLQKQQVQHQAEQQRWEKEKEKQMKLMESQEAELQQRVEECKKMEEKLTQKDLELKNQWETYQQDLERLRDTTQKLDREKELISQEKKRLEKMKSKLIPNYDDPTRSSTLFPFPSFRSTIVNGGATQTLQRNPSVLTSDFLDPDDPPPRVPPRRESISPRSNKQKLPVQLISATNQVQKPAEVQQKIPKKLAAESKAREKTLKAKRTHKRAHSAANLDFTNVMPIRATGKDGGSLRTQTNTGQRRALSSDTFRSTGPSQNVKPSQSFLGPKWNDITPPPPVPPPFPKDINSKDMEKVIVL
ncbi:PREDICTED: rho guanine nucleotide exchange factor 18-like isoform X1 [Cyprinodon variegatus]|nr:PREDICTED: rho guanine nucleotide exchange factor 18-like isoform X1 [Cyprinodon variegatus]